MEIFEARKHENTKARKQTTKRQANNNTIAVALL
jgi:hypothetical protein